MIWHVSATPRGKEAGSCVYMNATLPTEANVEWEPQKDSLSEKGTQASANSSFIDNLERPIVVLLKVFGGSKYHK